MCFIHKWSKWSDLHNNNCLLTQRRNCEKCNKIEVREIAQSHFWGQWEEIEVIVQKNNGLTPYDVSRLRKECKVCGDVQIKRWGVKNND